MDFFEILKQIMVPNKDDGSQFTDTQRLDKINEMLWHSKYRRVNADGLFVLYSAKPLSELRSPVLISSHIDCLMSRCFTEEYDEKTILGTYDNCITNAAVLALMLEGSLDADILVAFTGDEERDSEGALQLCNYLSKNQLIPLATLVLDVTDMGWGKADFTIENNFWMDALGRKIVGAAAGLDASWQFVPSDPDEVPEYVPTGHVIFEEAEADESWDYDEKNFACFSLCIPVKGDMHSNRGVLARKDACLKYIQALKVISNGLSKK